MLSEQLNATVDVMPTIGFDRLAKHLPYEWIEQALSAHGAASVRRRRLPAEQVVWLVIALALFRGQSMEEVLSTLDLALPSERLQAVTKGAITQARERLGDAPLQWLFEHTAKAWCGQLDQAHAWKGLSLWAMDGTTFRASDSPKNRAHFGAQAYQRGTVASYPQIRGVSVTAVPTHMIWSMNFGQYGQNEMLYAKGLTSTIVDHSLTVFDKGFFSAEILLGLALSGVNRHYLIPVKCNTKWTVLSGEPDDCVVQLDVSRQARANAPDLPTKWTARLVRVTHNGKILVLLTSLLDQKAFKPIELAQRYQQRWEIETSYRELKHAMLGDALTLRSRLPEGVYQELWGALIAYNLVRLEIAHAAAQARVDPTDLSFIRALHIVQHELIWAAGMAPGKLPAHLQKLRLQLQFAIVEKRPGRKAPRVVKLPPSRYATRSVKKVGA